MAVAYLGAFSRFTACSMGLVNRPLIILLEKQGRIYRTLNGRHIIGYILACAIN